MSKQIHLNSKIGWRLPTTIGTTDFQDLHKKLGEKNPKAAQALSETYTLDENNIPPAYRLLPVPGVANHLEKRQELFDELCHVVTESQDEMYMNEGFPTEITTALAHHAGMSDNIIVTHRTIYNLPKDKTHPVNKLFLDIDTEGETNQHLLKKHRYLNTRVERIVSNECIMKWSLSWEEMEMALEGQQTPQVTSLCQKLENKLKAAVERISERQASVNPYLAEGLPPVLCQELVMHAHKQQQLLTNIKDMPHIVEPALQQLYSNPSVPLVLQGPVGSGMQTVGSFLALQEAKRDLPRLVALRFMTLTPESQTVMAALFTILEQVSIAFGVNKVFKDIKSLSLLEMIASIAACTTKEVVSIILCSVQWGMLGRGNEVEWIQQKLPPNVHLIVLTNCPTLSQNISAVQIPPMKPEQVEKFLLDRLKSKNRCLTKNQHDAVISVLSKNPLPVLAVLVAELATEWTSDTVQRPEELPTSMEEALVHLFKQAEKVVGVESVARILSYLSTAKFGLSDSELEDVLAMDDTLLSSIYPDRCPKVRRCPLSIWLYLKHKFAAVLDIAYVYGHRVYRWQRQVTGALVLESYDINPVPLHMLLTEYFRGKWASEPKPLPDPDNPEQTVAVPCAVIEQPNCFNRNTNCRKFLCLLYHMLQGISMPSEQGLHERRCAAAKQHLLDIRWLVTKLDATSLVQLLDDLQMAIYAASTMSTELTWLQLLVARNAHVLTVSGRQLHSRLHTQLMFERHLLQGGAPKGFCSPDKARRVSFQAAISRFEQAITNSPVPFLAGTDSKDFILQAVSSSSESRETFDSKVKSKSESLFRKPEASLNGFYSYDKDCRRVVSISTEAGEIVVWDTVNHRAVQTLRGIAKPSGLVFLDVNHVVVLCNRELKAFDLKEGVLTSDIRGMLNIKMPYFHVRDSETVIVLARNRMSVNVLDVKSGQIHATFKAGEDRFLNSLLVSGNGKILVCGDETQKPFPLLVWELGQSKLLHDLRMPQHEFITSIADITWNGHYVACGCRVSPVT
ncbi:NACHT domain- and WD repeat-containing protein 1-like [Littorina saxatilis]|uniref:NACHT domain- and WD repeat-containing protein 1-like n=1 Tax=Littorina saxatilis TaxID=31220 RepID=UPI0038B63B73